MRLSAVRIGARDLREARDFYGSVLGLELTNDGIQYGYCIFVSSGIRIILDSVPPDAPEDEQAFVGRFTGVSFEVEDIGAEFRRMVTGGVHFVQAPEKQFWGGTLATFEDPSGNQLQLVQYAG